MGTVVQATEHLIVESATAIITSVGTTAAGEFKEIEHNAAVEVLAATDEAPSSLLDKVEDGIQDIADEVVKGAEAAVVAVEAHPELIAEGALAVVIGAASLVQPELIAGSVALIGKMAADSAKTTVTKIATDTSAAVVKNISKDLADDAKEEAAKDIADAAAKKLAEATQDGQPAADSKAPSVEPVKDASTSSEIKDTPPTDPKAAPASVPTKEPTNGSASNPPEAKIVPETPTTTKDRTIAIEVAQEPSKAPTTEGASSSEAKSEPPPVSFKITLGADGEVKAVTKGGAEEKAKTPDPVPVAETLKTVSVEKTTKTAVVSTETKIPEILQAAPTLAQQPVAISEKKPAETQETAKPSENEPKIVAEAPKEAKVAAKPAPLSASQLLNISDKKPVETIEEAPKAESSGPDTSVANDASQYLELVKPTQDVSKATPNSSTVVQGTPQALWSPTVVSAVSNVSTITSTTKTQTLTQPTTQNGMVTISQESLDLLHSKIDTMHNAIQQITAVLAYHLPTPSSAGGSHPKAIKSSEEEINEALASAVKPLSELLPEIMAQAQNDDTTHPPLEDPSASPKKPGAEKRTSVLAVIGKVFWPFGGDKVASVTVTEVDTERSVPVAPVHAESSA